MPSRTRRRGPSAARAAPARERERLVERLRPVVDVGQEVEVQFNARVLH
jgi:hypothetical protein